MEGRRISSRVGRRGGWNGAWSGRREVLAARRPFISGRRKRRIGRRSVECILLYTEDMPTPAELFRTTAESKVAKVG